MKKIKILFISTAIFLAFNFVTMYLYAQEDEQVVQEENELKQKEDIVNLINEYLVEIDDRINNIDLKIENSKNQEEFDYYPAIRLNIDTPFFGITSLVENKLKVKRDISTSDVANGYSIRNIVDNKIIRLPDSILGAIVVSTKEYNISTDMTMPQLKLTLVKCIQYLSQVDSANDFVDDRINKIFKDYIDEQKQNAIKDIRDRNDKMEQSLEDISDKISKLSLLGKDVTNYKDTYFEVSSQLYNIDKYSKNTLILEDELTELAKTSLTNESAIIDLQNSVSKSYEEALKDVDYGGFLGNISKEYEARTNRMNDYIEASTTQTKEIVNDKEEIKTTVNYDVTSRATLEYMQIELDNINIQLDEYNIQQEELKKQQEEESKNNEEQKNQEDQNSQEQQEKPTQENVDDNTLIEENREKIDTLFSKYKEFLSRENSFYINNINMLLKDSNDKVSSIIAEIDSGIEVKNDIFEYTKYVYIDLPDNLTKYINENNMESTLEIDTLITQLMNQLKDLSNKNTKITNMYNDMIAEILKS
mgnify:CR=1 FL=1